MILLDTHAWIWFVNAPEQLTPRALQAIQQSRDQGFPLLVSSISAWEFFMLIEKKRLEISMPPDLWLSKCERVSTFRFQPVDNDIARHSVTTCSTMHPDPADRMIVATALAHGAKIITCDRKIHDAGIVPCIWS